MLTLGGTERSGFRMRALSLEFHGYASGEVVSADRYGAFDPASDERSQLDAAVTRIAQTVDAGDASFVAITVVGFSDRNDTPGLSCDDRRASESNASKDRSDSALSWLIEAVGAQLVTPLADWHESSDRVTWIQVPTGAALLANDPPLDDAQRAENRRVKFVFSFFDA